MSRILKLTASNFPKLKDLRYFLFDCDGVLWNEDTLIGGARTRDLICFLQKQEKKVFLVTNNCTKSRAQYVTKCRNLNLDVAEDEIISAAYIAARYIREQAPKGKIFVVGMEGMDIELTKAGLPHVMCSMSKVPQLSVKNFPKLKDLKYFLFDCDGVIWLGSTLIDGAKDLINFLQSKGKKVFLVTNNSTKSRSQYVTKCQGLGLEITQDQIISTAYIAAQYVHRQAPKGKIFVIGSQGLDLELTEAGLPHVMSSDESCSIDLDTTSVEDITIDPDVSDVLVGYDSKFNYTKLLFANSYIHRGCRFFATNTDAFFPTDSPNVILPGTGAIVRSVEMASGTAPIVMGKPHAPMMEVLVSDHGVEPELSLMVGDRLDTDILFGKAHGIVTAAVLSGVTTREQLDGPLDADLRPDFRMETVRDLLTALQDVLGS